jgi:hypothetical protein
MIYRRLKDYSISDTLLTKHDNFEYKSVIDHDVDMGDKWI